MAVNGEEIVPGIGKKQAAVLNNESARRLEHERHLEELGFPKYVEPGYMRHAPVSYDDPDNPTPSRIVNQAGQDLGDQNKDESDHFAKNTYKPAKPLAKEAFLEFMSKEDPPPNRSQAELQRTEELGLSPDATATEIAQAQGQKDLMYRPDLNDPSVQEASYLAGYDPTTGEAGYRGFTTDAEGNRVAKDPMIVDTADLEADDPRLGSTFARPGMPDIYGNPTEGSGSGGAITFKDIKPKTEDDAGDGLSDISNSIQKSMEIFSNLVMKDELSDAAEKGKEAVKDIGTAAGERGVESFLEGINSLITGEAFGLDSSEEEVENTTEEVKEKVEEKIKEETAGMTPKTKLTINFPTYTQYKSTTANPTPVGYVDYARSYAQGYDETFREMYPEKAKEIREKITYKPDDPDASGIPTRFTPGMRGTTLGRGGTESRIVDMPKVPKTEAATYIEEPPLPPEEKIDDPKEKKFYSDETEITGTEVFMPRVINETKGKNVPSTLTYTLDIKPADQIDIPNVSPEKKEQIVTSALQSIGLQGSGNANRFAYTPPPATPQQAMQISPDQRMPQQMRADLAQAAFDREVARLTAGAKNITKMEKYEAWIQKAEDEGAMAKVQLDRVSDLADMMHDALDEEDQLPGWIQNKISDSLHNLEASFTHIAYDKKQDMELSKSKEMFTNILQKDNHTPQSQVASQIGNPMPQSFAALVGATNEVNKNRAGIKNLFSGSPSLNPIKTIKGLGNKFMQGLGLAYGEDSLNFKKPLQMAKPLTVGTQGSVLRGSIKGGAAGVGASLVAQQLLPIYSDILFPEMSDSSKETLKGIASFQPQSPSKMAELTGELAQQVVPSPERLNQRKDSFMSAINSLKNVGQGIFKEDISLQKDEGGFDALGRPRTPAMTGQTTPPNLDYRDITISPKEELKRKKAYLNTLSPSNPEYAKLAAEVKEDTFGKKVPAAVPADFEERFRTASDPYRKLVPESSFDTSDLSAAEKATLKRNLATRLLPEEFRKPGLGELPDTLVTHPTQQPTGAEQRAKIERISQQIPESSKFKGRDTLGRGALTAGSKRGTINTMYDQLLDDPKTSLGAGMESPRPFGQNPRIAYERMKGAKKDQFLAPPTKREISEVLDQVADWSQSKVKTAARGALKGKKGLLSLLGAAGLGTAFNYLQDKGSDLLDDGGNTRIQ